MAPPPRHAALQREPRTHTVIVCVSVCVLVCACVCVCVLLLILHHFLLL